MNLGAFFWQIVVRLSAMIVVLIVYQLGGSMLKSEQPRKFEMNNIGKNLHNPATNPDLIIAELNRPVNKRTLPTTHARDLTTTVASEKTSTKVPTVPTQPAKFDRIPELNDRHKSLFDKAMQVECDVKNLNCFSNSEKLFSKCLG